MSKILMNMAAPTVWVKTANTILTEMSDMAHGY